MIAALLVNRLETIILTYRLNAVRWCLWNRIHCLKIPEINRNNYIVRNLGFTNWRGIGQTNLRFNLTVLIRLVFLRNRYPIP